MVNKEATTMKCPKCQGRATKYGTMMTRNGRKQRWHCQVCGYVFTPKE